MIYDLTGLRFGRLLVTRIYGSDKYKKRLWECNCNCGRVTKVVTAKLIGHNTKSCGCLRAEILRLPKPPKYSDMRSHLREYWRGRNRMRDRSIVRDYQRAWMSKNRLKMRHYQREHKRLSRLKFPERHKRYQASYRRSHLMLVAGRHRTSYVFRRIRAKKIATTKVLLGADEMTIREYIERQFLPGMNWNNYGFYGWHIDHKVPCSWFDMSDPEQQRCCFHYTNLQPKWRLDNQIKGNRYADGCILHF